MQHDKLFMLRCGADDAAAAGSLGTGCAAAARVRQGVSDPRRNLLILTGTLRPLSADETMMEEECVMGMSEPWDLCGETVTNV